MALPVLLRRRWPRGVLIACSVLLLGFYSLARRDISPVPLLCLPLYDAAAAGFLALAIIIPAFFMVAGLIIVGGSTHQGVLSLASEFLPSVVVLLLAVLLGERCAAGARSRRRRPSGSRLAAAQREREAARRVTEERLRIARDLHDTVAHSMATIAVQAGSALHVLGPAQAGSGAGRRGAGRGARGAERDPGYEQGGAGRHADYPRRAARRGRRAGIRRDPGGRAGPAGRAERRGTGRPGAPVTVVIEGEQGRCPGRGPLRLPDPAGVLTNVLRHAGPQARAEVSLRYEHAALTIEVTDDGQAHRGRPATMAAAHDCRGGAGGAPAGTG